MGRAATDTRPPTESADPAIVAAPPRRLTPSAARLVGVAVAVLVLSMIATLVAAVRHDANHPYPGSRSGADANLIGNAPTLQGSAVDDFETPVATGLGRYPGLGDWVPVRPA